MTALHQQQCRELSPEDALDVDDGTALLLQLEPKWLYDTGNRCINHNFAFENFYQTMAFANVVAQIAHQQDHHPQLSISYNRCEVSYSTHSVGGLSLNDFICAARINAAIQL